MAEHIFTDYSDATQALRIKDLKQSLYDDGEVIMDKVLVCLHGDEHKKRRKLENKIFTRDVFQKYENIIFPKTKMTRQGGGSSFFCMVIAPGFQDSEGVSLGAYPRYRKVCSM